MSGKSRVRRTRRTNTHDEESEIVKLDDSIDQSDDSKSTKSNDTEKLDLSFKEETNGHDPPNTENTKDKTATSETSPKKPDELIVVEKTNGQSDETNTNTITNTNTATNTNINTITNTNTNTNTIVIANETSAEKSEPIKNGEDQSSVETEPISVDSEDPELQFPSEQNSDKSSEVELSPTLNRCRTRRSHTRNLPTPKTPKVPDLCEDEPLPETPEIVITIADDISENVSLASNISIDGSIEEKTYEPDLADASIFVNLGNDTTKNFDLTVQSNNLEEEEGASISNFLETTKDKSYGETLRCLTGRKTARNYNMGAVPPRMYRSTIELHTKDKLDGSRMYAPSVGGGTKRRLDADSPGDKRMRTEDVSPGILSYLTSPFKSKVGMAPSSTPKLTSFKYVHHGSSVIDEVSKVDLEAAVKPTEPKKWCSIQ